MRPVENDINADFEIVGAGYKKYEPQIRKQTWREKLKGKPVLSMIILAVIILGCILAPILANHDPSGFYLDSLNAAPNEEFHFGTDSLGRDIFSMIWYGGRVSIVIGLLSMVMITIIGVIYGCISGYAGAKGDLVMMRAAEIGNSIPSILLVLMLVAIMGKQNMFTLSVIISVTSWFGLARIVRSEVRQIRMSDYVLAARCMGSSFSNLMLHHLIPNFVSAIMFVVISSISSSISMESTLSFLGLGLPVDVISWGSMLSLANKALLLNTWWVIIIPGLFLLATLLCITNIGNYFRKEINRGPSRL